MSDSVLLDIAPWLLLILAAEFVNGWTDAPHTIATVVSTRVMRPTTPWSWPRRAATCPTVALHRRLKPMQIPPRHVLASLLAFSVAASAHASGSGTLGP